MRYGPPPSCTATTKPAADGPGSAIDIDMSTKKRVYPESEAAEAEEGERGNEGATQELVALAKRVEDLRKDMLEVHEKYEALVHSLYDYDGDGKKYSVLKKVLGMSNFHHAWIKHAEEVNSALKMPERDTGNGWKKNA